MCSVRNRPPFQCVHNVRERGDMGVGLINDVYCFPVDSFGVKLVPVPSLKSNGAETKRYRQKSQWRVT